MKIRHLLAMLIMLSALASCEYDNYDAPSHEYKGALLCDGKPFQYDANRSLFRFYQKGFGKEDSGTALSVLNDGTFSQLLFDDTYKLTLVNQTLPFEMPDFPSKGAGLGYDSIAYRITGNIVQNFEVHPYYKISGLSATLSENSKNIVATFEVERMTNTEKEAPALKSVKLYLSTSKIVDSGTSCMRSVNMSNSNMGTYEVSIPLAFYRDKKYYINNFRTYAFYRVALELDGIPDYYLFSEIKKIEGLPVDN